MPRDTPQTISSDVPPSPSSVRERHPFDLDLRIPERIFHAALGEATVFPISEGATKSEITCHAVSVVSEL
jgi:hypothetical protein